MVDWIPCSEMMPEDYEENKGKKVINVLVTTDTGVVTKVQRHAFRRYGSQEVTFGWGRIRGEMKAWMPLPKPYKKPGEKK